MKLHSVSSLTDSEPFLHVESMVKPLSGGSFTSRKMEDGRNQTQDPHKIATMIITNVEEFIRRHKSDTAAYTGQWCTKQTIFTQQ
ncbi:hypothetical protein KY290_001983 [Solanum tuberosum]|uniref:Uncharacterized protein n=1 Tax=Solanum tuberosum TaxID=4113 RepID=A0ABQ7WR02_SOLTU|nr:hypothetical protein KY290_001983 [Solanum tuberosum]